MGMFLLRYERLVCFEKTEFICSISDFIRVFFFLNTKTNSYKLIADHNWLPFFSGSAEKIKKPNYCRIICYEWHTLVDKEEQFVREI